MSTPRKSVQRRDATGHLNPQYSEDLLRRAREGKDDSGETDAFILRNSTREELGEELGEAFVESATSGESSEPERHERIVSAEDGGPFVTTSAAEEFAAGTDESNIAEATREPFPTTSGRSGSE